MGDSSVFKNLLFKPQTQFFISLYALDLCTLKRNLVDYEFHSSQFQNSTMTGYSGISFIARLSGLFQLSYWSIIAYYHLKLQYITLEISRTTLWFLWEICQSDVWLFLFYLHQKLLFFPCWSDDACPTVSIEAVLVGRIRFTLRLDFLGTKAFNL